jgi:putative spermidine/putrescine transport system permease protein
MAHASTRRGPAFYFLAAFFALFVAFLYGPMLIIFLLSFQGTSGGLTFPMRGVSTHWFVDLWSSSRYGDLGGAFSRSVILGVLSMLITAACCLFAGLAFRRKFWGAGPLFYLSIVSLVVPGILLGLGISAAGSREAALVAVGARRPSELDAALRPPDHVRGAQPL